MAGDYGGRNFFWNSSLNSNRILCLGVRFSDHFMGQVVILILQVGETTLIQQINSLFGALPQNKTPSKTAMGPFPADPAR